MASIFRSGRRPFQLQTNKRIRILQPSRQKPVETPVSAFLFTAYGNKGKYCWKFKPHVEKSHEEVVLCWHFGWSGTGLHAEVSALLHMTSILKISCKCGDGSTWQSRRHVRSFQLELVIQCASAWWLDPFPKVIRHVKQRNSWSLHRVFHIVLWSID